jgi:hypothetical protein
MSSFAKNFVNLENKILNIPGNIVDGMKRNNIANSIVLLLLLYVILAAPRMSQTVVKLFNNNFFKLVYLFLVMCLVSQNPILSVIGAVVLLIILNKLSESRTINIIPEANTVVKPIVLQPGAIVTTTDSGHTVVLPPNLMARNNIEKFSIYDDLKDKSQTANFSGTTNNQNLSGATTQSMGSQSNTAIDLSKQSMGSQSNTVIDMGSHSNVIDMDSQSSKQSMGSQSNVIDMSSQSSKQSMGKTVLSSIVPDKNNANLSGATYNPNLSGTTKKDKIEMSCKLVCDNKKIETFENTNERLSQRQQMMKLWHQQQNNNDATKEQKNNRCAEVDVNSSCDVLGTNNYSSTSHARVTVNNNFCPEDEEVQGIYENIDKEYAAVPLSELSQTQ